MFGSADCDTIYLFLWFYIKNIKNIYFQNLEPKDIIDALISSEVINLNNMDTVLSEKTR